MLVKQESFLDILGIPRTQFVVPVYQRVYSWGSRHCETLMNDVMEASKTGRSHFTGVLLFSADADAWGDFGRLQVVDGQQRITTVALMLVAFAEGLGCGRLKAEGITAQDIVARYLTVGSGEEAVSKLVLSHLDRGTFASLVDGITHGAESVGEQERIDSKGREYSARLLENLDLFRQWMSAADFDAEAFWRGLGSMRVISSLLAGEDSPQDVYESLNSKGSPLTAADLVRNALLFAPNESQRRKQYEKLWLPLEQSVNSACGAGMDALIRAWLASHFRNERVHNEADAYAVLKEYLAANNRNIEDMLVSLAQFGKRYVADEQWRAQADNQAKNWLQAKPRALGSGLKLFGS